MRQRLVDFYAVLDHAPRRSGFWILMIKCEAFIQLDLVGFGQFDRFGNFCHAVPNVFHQQNPLR